MHITDFVHTLSFDWQQKYKVPVHKLSLSGNFTCPNRDGTIGKGGCTFCSVNSFSSNLSVSLKEQLEIEKKSNKRSKLYFAYFQSYTSSYAEVSFLKKMYDDVVNEDNVVGLCIGTRPDCVSLEFLKLLQSYKNLGKDIILELGIQTANDNTLKLINRGHNYKSFSNTCRMAVDLDINVCAHLIIGLPNESIETNLISLKKIIEDGASALKLHPLHIVKDSIMEKQYKQGKIKLLTDDEYVLQASEIIAHTPPNIIFHRVSATARKPFLIAPSYCETRFEIIDKIANYLSMNGVQGSAIGQPYIKQN